MQIYCNIIDMSNVIQYVQIWKKTVSSNNERQMNVEQWLCFVAPSTTKISQCIVSYTQRYIHVHIIFTVVWMGVYMYLWMWGGHWRNLAIIPRQQPLKPSFFYHLNAAFFFLAQKLQTFDLDRSIWLCVCLLQNKIPTKWIYFH